MSATTQAEHPPPSPTNAPATSPRKPKLLDQLRAAIRVRHYSIRTEHSYVAWVRRYCHYHNLRHPAEMGAAEINAFLSHLAVEGNVAVSTQNQQQIWARAQR
jgi:hypothetical protein